jgi:calcineurin-like phosphoesterase family protein
MKYFFTADEHYAHCNKVGSGVIQYSNRPFKNTEEMDKEIIKRHNSVVSKNDTVVHCGDFTLLNKYDYVYENYVKKLNGSHIFLKGSHDRWLNKIPNIHERWEKNINGLYIVCDHYAGRVWPRSHYGSFQCHGHSHGGLKPIGRQYDVGVDNNDFYPVSIDKIKELVACHN